MKTNKRLISLLLTLAMVLSCLPGIALLASAAEIEKPQGISIVRDFDVVKGTSWVEALNLPETVKVDGVDTAVTWADAADYVDASVVGYYYIPGTVNGEEKAVTITIEVREKENLIYNGDFSAASDGWSGSWGRFYEEFPAGSGNNVLRTRTTKAPVSSGSQVLFQGGSATTALAEAITAAGTGEYGLTAIIRSDAYDDENPAIEGLSAWFDMRYKTDATASSSQLASNCPAFYFNSTSWTRMGVAFNVDAAWEWARTDIKVYYKDGEVVPCEVLIDNVELFRIDVLPLANEPPVITEITTPALAPLAFVKNYPDYVADWQSALELPATVTVAGSDGSTDTASVTWDISGLDLYKEGKYVLTGRVASAKYLNASDLVFEQVVLVREKTNLIVNGYFDEGTANWSGWTKKAFTDNENPAIKLTHKTPVASGSGSQGLFQSPDGANALGAAVTAAGIGQYYFGVKVKTVPYDDASDARTDMKAWPVLNTKVESNGSSKDLIGKVVAQTPVGPDAWTTFGYVVDIETSLAWVRTEVKFRSGDNTIPTAMLVDDFELFQLKGTLAMPADCEHTDRVSYVIEPDCVNAGYTMHVCPLCGDSYNDTAVDALGHTAAEAVVENEKAPTCGAAGSYNLVVYCSVCNEKLSSEVKEGEPATGEHEFIDGVCSVCGAEAETEPEILTDANLKFAMAPGLSFQDYIGVQIFFKNSTGKNYDRVYAIAVQKDPAGDVTTELGSFAYAGTYTVFEHKVMAWSMAESVTITLYGEKDGKVYQGQVIETSVEALALAKIADYASKNNAKACTALVDMLNYGAAVQISEKHNADKVPSAGEYAQYATATNPAFDATNVITGSGVKVYANNVSMQAKVEIQLMFKTADMEGKTFKATVNGTEAAVEYTPYSSYTICRVAVGASQMRDTFTIALYDAAGNAVSAVYEVSVEAYGQAQLSGTKADVVNAMMKYGDAVAAIG